MNFCHKLLFSNFNIIATQCRRPLIFQTMKDVRSKNGSLKYQRFKSSGCKDIRLTKIEFVAKTQFLYFKGTVYTKRNFNLHARMVMPRNLWNLNRIKMWEIQSFFWLQTFLILIISPFLLISTKWTSHFRGGISFEEKQFKETKTWISDSSD